MNCSPWVSSGSTFLLNFNSNKVVLEGDYEARKKALEREHENWKKAEEDDREARKKAAEYKRERWKKGQEWDREARQKARERPRDAEQWWRDHDYNRY